MIIVFIITIITIICFIIIDIEIRSGGRGEEASAQHPLFWPKKLLPNISNEIKKQKRLKEKSFGPETYFQV